MNEPEEVATIPLVEERMEVGKRAVENARVKIQVLRHTDAHVEDVPVIIRSERAEIEREEAVVGKQAFAREELVVRRDVAERVEEIADTVRRTEVEVERVEAPEDPVLEDALTDSKSQDPVP